MKAQDPRLTQILRPVEEDLRGVRRRLMSCLRDPFARRAVYLITAGGKLLRPSLVLLAGRSGAHEQQRTQLIELAAATELIHTATLIHDDIIDGALVRRRRPTFHQRFGTERAVLTGDYLYATAFSLMAGLRDPYVTRFMAEVCRQMSRGELLEVESRYDLEVTDADYLRTIRDKTASLMEACCHLGAHVAGAAVSTVARVATFGLNFGMAFQIVDDCLDLEGEERIVGKTLRSDLDKGSLSLPVIYLGALLPAGERRALFAPLRGRRPTRDFLSRVARAAVESGALAQAREIAWAFLDEATAVLAEQDGVGLVETFRELASYARDRAQ